METICAFPRKPHVITDISLTFSCCISLREHGLIAASSLLYVFIRRAHV